MLKQHLDYKSLTVKTFDRNTLKIKSVLAVIKNKKKFFQLCLDRTCTLVLSAHFSCAHGHASKIARTKIRAPRNKFVHPFVKYSWTKKFSQNIKGKTEVESLFSNCRLKRDNNTPTFQKSDFSEQSPQFLSVCIDLVKTIGK